MFHRGLIVGKFAPLHRGHQLLIETALSECRHVTVMVWSRPDFLAMPQTVRAGWISAIYPQVDVRAPADPPPDSAQEMVHRVYVREYLVRSGLAVDVVFTGEDYGDGFASVLGVPHRRLDRQHLEVSGSAIRRDLVGHSAMLSDVVLTSIGKAKNLDERG